MAEFVTYGPGSDAQGLAEAQASLNKGRLTSPAAVGQVPAPVQPFNTAGQNTAAAIGAGTQVYSQLPGYKQDIATAGANIASELGGNVPSDVANNLRESAAESGVSTGGASNAAYLKSLGLTSLGLEGQGLSELEGLLPTLPGANIASNPGFYVTPGQQYESDVQNSVWRAAPQPSAAAAAGLAATGAGYNMGAGSIRPSPAAPVASPLAQPVAQPSPANVVTGSGVDQGNAPGSPGAIANWSDWYAGLMNGDTGSSPGQSGGDDY